MLYKSSNLWLFLVLSLNFWAAPLLPGDLASEVFTDGLIAATLVAALALQGYLHSQFRGWAIGAGLFVVAAVMMEEMLPDTRYVENASFALCFAAVTVFYFNAMARTLREVTADTVFAAVCAYMLIGLFFACVFGLVVEHNPAAFTPEGAASAFFDQLYYSFATLTTLGAADIVPVSQAAKLLTVFEAVIGLIYIAILVGAVVGAFSAGIVNR
ncbi:MAG: ion channel [Rhodobacteraceae bacterium]|nr:ion channel [Paracoccaceae bacterium]